MLPPDKLLRESIVPRDAIRQPLVMLRELTWFTVEQLRPEISGGRLHIPTRRFLLLPKLASQGRVLLFALAAATGSDNAE